MNNPPDSVIVPILNSPINKDEVIYAYLRFTPPGTPKSDKSSENIENIENISQEIYEHQEIIQNNREVISDSRFTISLIALITLFLPIFGVIYIFISVIFNFNYTIYEYKAYKYLVFCTVLGIIINISLLYTL